MDKTPRSLPSLQSIFITIVLGLLVGIGTYQAAQRGYLHLKTPNLAPGGVVNEKTRTIINEENAVIDVVERTSPSVVAIGTTKRVFDPFDPFSEPKSQSSTVGTGFVVSDKGIIVTNKHVVAGSEGAYTVVTRDGKKYEIKKIYRDPVLDLAIVQVDATDLKSLELGDSSKLKVGQTVIAIGNALGKFTNTVTTGIVSGLGRRVVAGDPYEGSLESLENLIQTDAAINPGNSGGPLLNSAGQVIGVNVATTEGAQNIGFAIPISSVTKIVDEFVSRGTVSRPFLGVRYRFISKDVAILNEVPQGAYIQEVVKGSAADKVGVKEGDIITQIDGKKVESENSISEVISTKNIGDKVPLKVWTDGKEREVTATLQELPSE